jgi:hypothetical protein
VRWLTRRRNRRQAARTRRYRVTVAWLEAAAICASGDELDEFLCWHECVMWPGQEDEDLAAEISAELSGSEEAP